MARRTKLPIKQPYVGNPLSETAQCQLDELIERAKDGGYEKQVVASVGDDVWCKFEDTPNGCINPGVVIGVETDAFQTVYTVLQIGTDHWEGFRNDEFGDSIFREGDL